MSVEMSLVWLTISEALVRSIAMVHVQSEKQSRLKPWAILCATGRKVNTVEWLERKPCSLGETGSELSSGCRRRSWTLTVGQRIVKNQLIWVLIIALCPIGP